MDVCFFFEMKKNEGCFRIASCLDYRNLLTRISEMEGEMEGKMEGQYANEVKLFGKWSYEDVEVRLAAATIELMVKSLQKGLVLKCTAGDRHIPSGLSCGKIRQGSVCPSYSWTLPSEAF